MPPASTNLISAEQLASTLRDPSLRIFDCTVHLVPDPKTTYRVVSGRDDWLAGHLPGAGFLDLTGSLSDQDSPLRFTMLPAEQAAAAFAKAGVVDGITPVLYSTTHPMWATRVWWMLHSLGVHAMLLNGGMAQWRKADGAVEQGPVVHPSGTLSITPRPGCWADQADVLAHVGDATTCTINALAAEVYRGDGATNYGRRGHITGSVNVPYDQLFQTGSFIWQPDDQLRQHFSQVQAFDRPVICYCGGGISATCDAFALTHLGHQQVRVYDGSMSDWVKNPDLPMTLGTEAS